MCGGFTPHGRRETWTHPGLVWLAPEQCGLPGISARSTWVVPAGIYYTWLTILMFGLGQGVENPGPNHANLLCSTWSRRIYFYSWNKSTGGKRKKPYKAKVAAQET